MRNKFLLLIVLLVAASAYGQAPLNLETNANGLTQNWAAGGNVTRGQIVKFSGGQVIAVTTSDTSGAVGVAITSASQGQSLLISVMGSPLVQVDGACTQGNVIFISPSNNGIGRCGTTATGQTIAISLNTIGTAGFVGGQLSPLSSAGGTSTTSLSAGNSIDLAQAPYNLKADGVFVTDATTTSGNGTITAPDGNFLVTATAGMTVYGVSNSGLATCPSRTTIISVVNATTITVAPGSVTSNQSGNCILNWGTDQTAVILSAVTAIKALPHCGTLQFPSGGILLQKGFWPSTPANCLQGGAGTGEGPSITIIGRSRYGTHFMFTPDFDFTTCNPSCIGGSSMLVKDFSMNGSNQTMAATSIAGVNGGVVSMVGILGGSLAEDVGLFSFATAVTGGTLTGLLVNGGQDAVRGSFVDNLGTVGCSVAQLEILFEDAFCGNVKGPAISILPGASLISISGAYGPITTANQPIIDNQGTYIAYGDVTNQTVVNSSALQMGNASAKAFLNQVTFTNAGTATSIGVFWSVTGGIVQAQGSFISGGATNGAIFDSGHPGTFQDFSGNTLTNFVPANFTGTYLTSSNEVNKVSVTVNSATVGPTTIFATGAGGAGLYRACFNMDVTTAGTGGTISATLSWNNGAAQTVTTPTLSITTINNEYPNGAGGLNTNPSCFFVQANASTNIQYTFTVAGATGTPATKAQVSLEKM